MTSHPDTFVEVAYLPLYRASKDGGDDMRNLVADQIKALVVKGLEHYHDRKFVGFRIRSEHAANSAAIRFIFEVD